MYSKGAGHEHCRNIKAQAVARDLDCDLHRVHGIDGVSAAVLVLRTDHCADIRFAVVDLFGVCKAVQVLPVKRSGKSLC